MSDYNRSHHIELQYRLKKDFGPDGAATNRIAKKTQKYVAKDLEKEWKRMAAIFYDTYDPTQYQRRYDFYNVTYPYYYSPQDFGIWIDAIGARNNPIHTSIFNPGQQDTDTDQLIHEFWKHGYRGLPNHWLIRPQYRHVPVPDGTPQKHMDKYVSEKVEGDYAEVAGKYFIEDLMKHYT